MAHYWPKELLIWRCTHKANECGREYQRLYRTKEIRSTAKHRRGKEDKEKSQE